MSTYDDRTRLEIMLTALDGSPTTLRREMVGRPAKPIGDWAIIGKSGHIYPDGDGFLLVIETGESTRRWKHIKRHLSFCSVTQDGDDEGCVRLDRLPTRNEAATIRGVLGIRKRMHHSPEALARMALTAFRPTPENAT